MKKEAKGASGFYERRPRGLQTFKLPRGSHIKKTREGNPMAFKVVIISHTYLVSLGSHHCHHVRQVEARDGQELPCPQWMMNDHLSPKESNAY